MTIPETEITLGQMTSVLARIADLRWRTYRLIGFEGPSVPGRPAPEELLARFENWLGFALPPTYRLFQQIHDGWQHWSGDVALLSVSEMVRGPYHDAVEEWRARNAPGDPVLKHAMVVGFSLFAGEQIFFDLSDTERPVVVWDRGEAARFPSFFAYLEYFRGVLEEVYASDLHGR
ncbi:MAG: SMI1/KNR4 family protein [Bryobacteraceae bacterium]